MQQLKREKELPAPRVLIIEPEENIIEFLHVGLRYEGYLLEGYQLGLEGLEAARRTQPHLIILELALPDIDGLELCRRLRREAISPLLALTQLKNSQTLLQAREAGASVCMTKPFDFDKLLEQIKFLAPLPQSTTLKSSSIWEYDVLKAELPPEWWPSRKRPFDD